MFDHFGTLLIKGLSTFCLSFIPATSLGFVIINYVFHLSNLGIAIAVLVIVVVVVRKKIAKVSKKALVISISNFDQSLTLTLTFYFSEKKLEYNTVQLHVYKEEYMYA